MRPQQLFVRQLIHVAFVVFIFRRRRQRPFRVVRLRRRRSGGRCRGIFDGHGQQGFAAFAERIHLHVGDRFLKFQCQLFVAVAGAGTSPVFQFLQRRIVGRQIEIALLRQIRQRNRHLLRRFFQFDFKPIHIARAFHHDAQGRSIQRERPHRRIGRVVGVIIAAHRIGSRRRRGFIWIRRFRDRRFRGRDRVRRVVIERRPGRVGRDAFATAEQQHSAEDSAGHHSKKILGEISHRAPCFCSRHYLHNNSIARFVCCRHIAQA